MVNSIRKNTNRVAKATKPQLSVDWTLSAGTTPFFVHETDSQPAHYAVAVETGISVKTADFDPNNYKEAGVVKILKHYNKNTTENLAKALRVAVIPPGASGSYVPVRPLEGIKVLVTIPDERSRPTFIFDELPEEQRPRPPPFDEIQLNSFKLQKRAGKIAKMLEKFGDETENFEGRVYNVDLKKEATKVRNFVSVLSNLIEENGFSYSNDTSDLIMLGISGSGPASFEYRPIYAQINKGDGFNDLPIGFDVFRESNFAASNTMYIYKNLSSIENKLNSVSSSLGWEEFLNNYIHFPKAIVKHTNPRPASYKVTTSIRDAIRQDKDTPVKTQEELDRETWRIKSQEFKEEIDKEKKAAKEWVGDNVIGNLNNVLHNINKLEDTYDQVLDKLGITYIVKAAIKCTGIELPIEEIKAFIRDVNAFAEDVIAILKIPTITLDDLIPTVDIMWDIAEQVGRAILESVKTALMAMVKQIILNLLESCGDPNALSKVSFGGVPIGAAFARGGVAGVLESGVVGTLAAGAGEAALSGLTTGLKLTGKMPEESKKFLLNLNTFVSNDKVQELASEGFAPLRQVIDQISAVLTPGEMSKLLQGKAPESVTKMIKNVTNGLANAPEAPAGTTVISELLNTPDKANDFFLNIGKMIDEEPILKQIEDFEKLVPSLAGGLCDFDDSLLRQKLLSDKGLGPTEAKEQIEASRNRARSRINELAKILEKPNALDGTMPPVFCTYKDGKLQQGLVNRNHDSFMFMMNTTLDTVFDGVRNSFNEDISRVPSLMKIDVPGEVKSISRTSKASTAAPGTSNINGQLWEMNPQFEMAVKEGYRPNPPYWKAPILNSDGTTNDNPSAAQISKAHRKTIEWNHSKSPLQKSTMENTFMPGLSGPAGNYNNFETSLGWAPGSRVVGTPIKQNQNARKLLNADRKILQLSIDDPGSGLLRGFGGVGKSAARISIELARRNPKLAKLFTGINKYAILCASFEDAAARKDKFSVLIKADGDTFYNHLYNTDIKKPALNVIQDRNLKSDFTGSAFSTKEKHFAHFLQKIWSGGENIYTLNSDSPIEKPSYGKGLITIPAGDGVAKAISKDQGDPGDVRTKNVRSLFEELHRDLMASCLTEVGKSKLLVGGGQVFDLLNLNPSCPDPGLLGLDGIKQSVLNMYNNIQCFENSLPNVTGLGDNRNNATEQSILFGTIKATARVYAFEAVLKCLITFSQFMVEDVDEVFVGYIRDKIIIDIKAKKYLVPFLAEVLKAYNSATHSTEVNRHIALDWFIREELKYAVDRLLTVSGVDKTEKHIDNFILNAVQTGLIPEFNAAGTGSEKFQRVNESENLLGRYHVGDLREIRGIKDWRNGNFYLEKYIRADIDYTSEDAKDQFGFSEGEMNYSHYAGTAPASAPAGDAADQGRFEGITNASQFPKWFYNEFRNFSAGSVKSNKTIKIPADPECNPSGLSFEGVLKKRGSLGTCYKNLRYGLRLVCQVTQDLGVGGGISNNTFFSSIKDEVFPPTSISPSVERAMKLNKTYYVEERTYISNDLLGRGTHHVEAFTFPIVCIEDDIPLDTSIEDIISSFAGDPSSPNNFFNQGYNIAYSKLIQKMKKTDEWSFIFDYCFPLKRLVSLAALYNTIYLLPFPGLEKVFTNTKEQLRMSFLSTLNSGNYQYNDPDWTNKHLNQAGLRQEIPGLDFGDMAAKFLVALLKGAGESFSPNIAIAKKLKDLADTATEAAYAISEDVVEFLDEELDIRLSDPKPPLPCPDPDVPFDADIPIFPISLGLAPSDIFWGSPMPPLGDLGLAYLIMFGASSAPGSVLLKTEEKKKFERCAEKNLNLNKTETECPPTGSIT